MTSKSKHSILGAFTSALTESDGSVIGVGFTGSLTLSKVTDVIVSARDLTKKTKNT